MTSSPPSAPTLPSEFSLEARLSALTEAEREKALEGLDMFALAYSWEYCGRPSQLKATESNTHTTLVLAGRGFGKTRIGSEWVRKMTRGDRPSRGFLAARTAADVRDTLINGESGLIATFPPSERPEWIASQRTVKFANGSTALCLSAKEPDQARGPQSEWSLCDEWATWEFSTTPGELDLWDNIQIATRLGVHPKLMLTTTPKRMKRLRDLVASAKSGKSGSTLITGSTYENIALSQEYMDVMTGLYGGTRLGAQELFAEVLDEVEGALWSEALLDEIRTHKDPGQLPLRVVGVDPSVADRPHDECGIIVFGATDEPRPTDRRGWVLADRSLLAAPAEWAKAVVKAARDFDAVVVAESNQGGAMVREMIHNVDRSVKVKLVHAKESKRLRAEPVSGVYEQKRISHLGRFPIMDDQMTSWVPGETVESPDRIDALVHAATALMLPSSRAVSGRSRVSSPARRVGTISTGALSVAGRGVRGR